jgi:hypothetical protein
MEEASRLYAKEIRVVELIEDRSVRFMDKGGRTLIVSTGTSSMLV